MLSDTQEQSDEEAEDEAEDGTATRRHGAPSHQGTLLIQRHSLTGTHDE
jgi:hypothetical protein